MIDKCDSLDLVVVRYEFGTKTDYSNRFEAIIDGARMAENILYIDIHGGLQLDLDIGWGGRSPDYPRPNEHNDGIASWQPNWHIPPYEYEAGIRWKPFDQMQQFDVKVGAIPENENYRGVVQIVAYVWDDRINLNEEGRLGCLVDALHRNKDRILLAEGSRISILMDKNSKDNINKANIVPYGDREDLFGFSFPPDDIGDTSHRPLDFTPIDIEEIRVRSIRRDR